MKYQIHKSVDGFNSAGKLAQSSDLQTEDAKNAWYQETASGLSVANGEKLFIVQEDQAWYVWDDPTQGRTVQMPSSAVQKNELAPVTAMQPMRGKQDPLAGRQGSSITEPTGNGITMADNNQLLSFEKVAVIEKKNQLEEHQRRADEDLELAHTLQNIRRKRQSRRSEV